MQTHLKNLIHTIKIAPPAEVKLTQKQVEKFWHDFYIPHREEGRAAFCLFLEELKNFEQIKDIDHQAYFINTLKWPLWAIGEEYFEDWADFLLKYIQHPSGKIRQAVIHATEYLILDIAVDLRYVSERGKDLTPDLKESVAKNRARFGCFVMTVEDLLDRYYEPRFKKYKYVSSLPIGVYKSLNKLIAEVLLRSEYYEKLYQDFLNELRAKRKSFAPPKITMADILKKQEEIENALADLIERTDSVLKIEDIKNVIYNEDGQRTIGKIMENFDEGQNIDGLNKILCIMTDAWNYWPHKKLGGISPAEKLLISQTK